MTTPEAGSVVYLLKMYPRFSETFILNEILALEAMGVAVEIVSQKKPDDGRFHADLSRVKAPVTYLPDPIWLAPRALARAHLHTLRRGPRRYLSVLADTLRRRSWASLKHFLRAGLVADWLARRGARHLHAHFASGAAASAHLASRLSGLPFSFTAHAKDIYHAEVDEAALGERLRDAAFAVTVSDFNLEHLRRRLGAGRSLVRIYNGLDLRQFQPRPAPPTGLPLILGVGRLVEKKGFEDLVGACAELVRRGVSFECRIVGKGPLEAPLRRQISALGLEECVHLVGPLARDALLDLYPRATVVAAPCVVGGDGNRDGLPTVLIEAMALGVPVVSTAVTGIPELVRDGETGLLVPERAPMALAEAIARLIAAPDLAARLAANARRRVEADFDLRPNVDQLRRLFMGEHRPDLAPPRGGAGSERTGGLILERAGQ